METNDVNLRRGTKVELRNLPPHRAKYNGMVAKVTAGLETRRHKMWEADKQSNIVGYIIEVVPTERHLWPSEFRVPAVCVYPMEG